MMNADRNPYEQKVGTAERGVASAQKALETAKAARDTANKLWERVEGLSSEELEILYNMIGAELGYDRHI